MEQRKRAPGTLRDKEVGPKPTALSRLQIIQIVLNAGKNASFPPVQYTGS